MSRLAPKLTSTELWTLPGGGIEFGEDPRDAVLREVHEETGLSVSIAETAWVSSARHGRSGTDTHAVRLIFEGWAAPDAPEPRVLEQDGSTVDAAWIPLEKVSDGSWPVVEWVRVALAEHTPRRVQRLAAKALIRRGSDVLLARLSPLAVNTGSWTLPGGGVDHGESPTRALARELLEETGLPAEVGVLLGVHDQHLTGTAPDGRHEDFHAVNLVFAASVPEAGTPHVREVDGTTDAVAWVPIADLDSGSVQVTELVRYALGLEP